MKPRFQASSVADFLKAIHEKRLYLANGVSKRVGTRHYNEYRRCGDHPLAEMIRAGLLVSIPLDGLPPETK